MATRRIYAQKKVQIESEEVDIIGQQLTVDVDTATINTTGDLAINGTKYPLEYGIIDLAADPIATTGAFYDPTIVSATGSTAITVAAGVMTIQPGRYQFILTVKLDELAPNQVNDWWVRFVNVPNVPVGEGFENQGAVGGGPIAPFDIRRITIILYFPQVTMSTLRYWFNPAPVGGGATCDMELSRMEFVKIL